MNAFPIIDAHLHFIGNHPDSLAMLEEFNLKLLNVCVSHSSFKWREIMATPYRDLARRYPHRYAWCTAFVSPGFDDPDYAERAIRDLERDFADGAIACKVWKDLGMDLRDPQGRYVMVDDPIFAPIFEHLAHRGKPLLMHIGEPLSCWQPLNPASPHYNYYSKNPRWHVYGRPGFPSHAEILAARDRVIENHPRLRVIGAHLGSLEHDVREIARRMERFPNFAVDTSARLTDLAFQDPSVVRDFLHRFSDRVLFGTDIVARTPQDQMTPEERTELLDAARANYRRHLAFLGGRAPVEFQGRSIPGLGLSADLMEKFFFANARAWYPGI